LDISLSLITSLFLIPYFNRFFSAIILIPVLRGRNKIKVFGRFFHLSLGIGYHSFNLLAGHEIQYRVGSNRRSRQWLDIGFLLSFADIQDRFTGEDFFPGTSDGLRRDPYFSL
jgi:hypothetical protein